jgi:hypothetical protein
MFYQCSEYFTIIHYYFKHKNIIIILLCLSPVLQDPDPVKSCSIGRHKDKGRSGGFGTRSRGVWVRNPTRSGIRCRDVTMPYRRQWKGTDFTVRYQID